MLPGIPGPAKPPVWGKFHLSLSLGAPGLGAVTFKASCVTAATVGEKGRNTSLVIYRGLKAALLLGILMHSPGVFTEPEL